MLMEIVLWGFTSDYSFQFYIKLNISNINNDYTNLVTIMDKDLRGIIAAWYTNIDGKPLSGRALDDEVASRTSIEALKSQIFPENSLREKFIRFKVLVEEPIQVALEGVEKTPLITNYEKKMKLFSKLHVALEIGTVTLHFLAHNLVEIRPSQAGTHVRLLYAADSQDLGQISNHDVNRTEVCKVVARWNATKLFHIRNNCSQHFVEDVYKAVNLSFITSDLLSCYVDYCNATGYSGYCLVERTDPLRIINHNGIEMKFDKHSDLHSKIDGPYRRSGIYTRPDDLSLMDMSYPNASVLCKAFCRGMSARRDYGDAGCIFGNVTVTTDRRPGDDKQYTHLLKKMSMLMQIPPLLSLEDRRNHHGAVRVLSIDGRGTRGIVALYILEYIERSAELQVFQIFDMVCGSGIGATIALCMVHLRMSARTIIDKLKLKAIEMYGDYKYEDRLRARPIFSTEVLYKTLDELIPWILNDNPMSLVTYPKMFTIGSSNHQQYFMRNYNVDAATNPNAGTCNCTISEAGRASAALPPYNRPVKIDDRYVYDDSYIANNASEEVLKYELASAFPGRDIEFHVVVGTGHFGDNIPNLPVSNKQVDLASNIRTRYEVNERSFQAGVSGHENVFRFDPVVDSDILLNEADVEAQMDVVCKISCGLVDNRSINDLISKIQGRNFGYDVNRVGIMLKYNKLISEGENDSWSRLKNISHDEEIRNESIRRRGELIKHLK